MEQQPLVSIIVTTYNTQSYVRQMYEGLQAQTEANWEAIIVDDGSTDGTVDLLRIISKNDPRVKLYIHQHQGRIPALNTALFYAVGSYIAIHDADDVSHPDRLQKELQFLAVHPRVGMVGTYATIIDADGTATGKRITGPVTDREIRKVIVRYNPFVHSSILFRREALLAHTKAPYSDRFLPGFEWEVYANVMTDWEAANISECLVSYRIHDKNLTSSRHPLQRLSNVTRARWYVFRKLALPFYQLPFVFSGIRDVL